MMKTDCLILGGGLAGMMAARETISAHLDTMMAEDGRGASPWVHGFNHPVRPGDSAEVFLEDTLRSGQGLSDPQLADVLCRDTEIIFTELQGLGLTFNRDVDGSVQAIRPLGASFPRVVSIGNETGPAVLNKLEKEIGKRMCRLSGFRAVRLLKSGSRVCGALLFDQRKKEWVPVYARAVILCTGGFCGIFPVTTNKRDSGGDGCAMAYEAGARLCDMEFIQFEPSASVWPPALNGTSMITTLFFEGAVLRNREGERFMLRYGEKAERVGKDMLSRCIAREITEGRGSEHGGVYMDVTGVDPDTLDRKYPMYVKRYQDVGMDLKSRWIELAPAPHTSLGGVCIDTEGRTSLEGLFACGEVTGGLHGANRIGGSGGLEPMVFGRRAGRAAAAYAKTVKTAQEETAGIPVSDSVSASAALDMVRREMGETLWLNLNVIRRGDHLRQAADTLIRLQCRAEEFHGCSPEESFQLRRLRNDLTTALLAVRSAETREETVGCHVREDYPDRSETCYRVVAQRDGSGGMTIEKRGIYA